MKVEAPTVLITGARRGLGLAFAQACLARGARKVFAAARDPSRVTLPGVTPVRLDVTSPAKVEAAAPQAGNVTLVVNTAGIAFVLWARFHAAPLLVMPTAIIAGRQAGRLGHRPFLVGGSLLCACSALWLLRVPGTQPDLLRDGLPGLWWSGWGDGMVLPSLAGAAFNPAPRQIGAVLDLLTALLCWPWNTRPRCMPRIG